MIASWGLEAAYIGDQRMPGDWVQAEITILMQKNDFYFWAASSRICFFGPAYPSNPFDDDMWQWCWWLGDDHHNQIRIGISLFGRCKEPLWRRSISTSFNHKASASASWYWYFCSSQHSSSTNSSTTEWVLWRIRRPKIWKRAFALKLSRSTDKLFKKRELFSHKPASKWSTDSLGQTAEFWFTNKEDCVSTGQCAATHFSCQLDNVPDHGHDHHHHYHQ